MCHVVRFNFNVKSFIIIIIIVIITSIIIVIITIIINIFLSKFINHQNERNKANKNQQVDL